MPMIKRAKHQHKAPLLKSSRQLDNSHLIQIFILDDYEGEDNFQQNQEAVPQQHSNATRTDSQQQRYSQQSGHRKPARYHDD